MNEQSEENKMVAKFQPVVMNLTSSFASSSSSMDSLTASRNPEIIKA